MPKTLNVRKWLTDNGFERFIEVFEDNEIDGDLLAELTREDLRDLGLPLGIQKRILKLIDGLEIADSADQDLQSSQETGVAERRQLTVMFCDLVGSTAMSSTMDEEDFREIIVAYQAACESAIKHYEGYVARLFGDGILIYFGYPRASENDSERAVLTALKIIEHIEKLSVETTLTNNVELAVRIGIATGSVVVGDLIGEGVAQESVALGDTPNLASHLQRLAKPNEMVLSSTTRRLLGDNFAFRDLGKFEIKGLTKPMTAWTVDRQITIEDSSHQDESDRLKHSPQIGRREEFDILKRRWEHLQQDEGQVVLISGEAGIGKSRIIEALKDEVRQENCSVLSYQCSPYYTGSPLHPVIEQLKRAAMIKRDDDADVMLEKLQTLIYLTHPNNTKILLLFADLLSIPTGEKFLPLQLTPQQQKHATFDALAQMLPGRSEFGGLTENLLREAQEAGVDFQFNTEVNEAFVSQNNADSIILATGAIPNVPEIPGAETSQIVTAWEVLRGEVKVGSNVLVADWGADWVGLGLAELLTRNGSSVQLAVNGMMAGYNLQSYVRDQWLGTVFQLGVEIIPYSRLFGVDESTVYLQHTLNNEPVICENVDTVVLALGHKSEASLEEYARRSKIAFYMIGDCLSPRTAEEAVYEGMKIARAV